METSINIYLIAYFASFILLIVGVVFLFRQYQYKQQAAINEKALLQQQHQQEILTTELEVQQQTMQYIGREIHDSVGQKLTLASLYAQQLSFKKQYPNIQEQLESIGQVINESLTELRSLSKSLTNDGIQEQTLEQLLQTECNKINATAICRATLHNATVGIMVPPKVKILVLRIVQEFIQNSLKHSQCKNLYIFLQNLNDKLYLDLKDDGKGFNTSQQNKGIGLRNMQKRADLLNATLQLESTPNYGTRLQLFILKSPIF